MKKYIYLLTIIAMFFASAQGVAQSPKKEFRALWIATVLALDWPSGSSESAQKSELVNILNEAEAMNFNAVIFQVRAECDAFYVSSYEPWSKYLTGNQGQHPGYDPLGYLIQEAHKRGIEVHAWFNPYRAEKTVGSYPLDPDHIAVEHPEWCLTVDSYKFLNPGLPEVRDYVNNVIMDVVRKYDIDGVHMDDYFYPYAGMNTEDLLTFSAYPRGFSYPGEIDDWRRDNVNIFIDAVMDSIRMVKPHVKFGVSPFGIYKDGVPSGITGFDAYSQIYCDPLAWLANRSVDYLTPQLYWGFGGGQDYATLMPWWVTQCTDNDRFCFPGLAAYKAGSSIPADDIGTQISWTRFASTNPGEVFFRTGNVIGNTGGVRPVIESYYENPAVSPTMPWLDTLKPNGVQNLTHGNIAEISAEGLYWDTPDAASDGDTARRYLIYRFTHSTVTESDLESSENIVGLTGVNYFVPPAPDVSGTYYYAVTALDHNNNESDPGTTVSVTSVRDDLASPLDYYLQQNFPNPFNPTTTIRFWLPQSAFVDLKIYNMQGELVKTLVSGNYPPGIHATNWDATNDYGETASSGIYIYRIVAGSFTAEKKMLLLK